jgi:hypothetical protein
VRWFSFDPAVHVPRPQLSCYLTHTSSETHRILRVSRARHSLPRLQHLLRLLCVLRCCAGCACCAGLLRLPTRTCCIILPIIGCWRTSEHVCGERGLVLPPPLLAKASADSSPKVYRICRTSCTAPPQDNLHETPVYGGWVDAKGPRYCPSIEDKIVRFADKESHQVRLTHVCVCVCVCVRRRRRCCAAQQA